MTQQPRVPWQVKYLALVLIWGSSFLLMKVGLESLSAVQISGLRILSGAAVLSVLLLARGGRLPTGRGVWGHLVRLRVLPRCTAVHALRAVRDQDQLGAGRHRQRRHAHRDRARHDGDPAGRAGHRVGGWSPWGSGSSASSRSCSRGRRSTGPTSSASRWRWPVARATASAGPTTGASSAASTSAGCRSPRRRCSPRSCSWCRWCSAGRRSSRRAWRRCGPTTPPMPAPGSGCRSPCVLVLGLVGTGFAYTLQFDVVRGAGPVIGSTITYLIPVVSVVLGVFVLGEPLGPWQIVGFVIVLGAAWVINRKPRAPEAVAQPRAGGGGRRAALTGAAGRSRGLRSSVRVLSPGRGPRLGGVGRGPGAARQHGDGHRHQPQRDDGQEAGRRPPAAAPSGGPGAAGAAGAGRGEHGLRRQHRLHHRDATEHEQEGPALTAPLAQGAHRPPGPPEQAQRHQHERGPDEPHQAAVGAASDPERNATYTQRATATHEQGRPHAEQGQARRCATLRGARGEPSGATEADGIRAGAGEPLTPAPGRAPRGAGSCRSAPWAARERPTPCGGTCRRRSAPWCTR